MISELDTVVLTRDLPEDGLEAGDVGTVVLVHGKGAGYEVEFTSLAGDTLAVVTVPAGAVRAVSDREIAHVRQVA
jgi:Domain of unknown function (DUF4926)